MILSIEKITKSYGNNLALNKIMLYEFNDNGYCLAGYFFPHLLTPSSTVPVKVMRDRGGIIDVDGGGRVVEQAV